MAKKICKCAICGIEFDRNAIQAVKHGARRYSHQTCEPNGEPVPMENPIDEALKELNDYIAQLYGDKGNYPLIKKQIKKFHDDYNYTYSGILKSLVYFYEVKHNSIENSNGGIGIVEYIYDQAKQYYFNIYLAQQNVEKTFVTKVKEYFIKPPQSKRLKKELNWGEEE